jgi:ElaB/YqjD/DUF883 family membrane-anchored ribosome-binding protein
VTESESNHVTINGNSRPGYAPALRAVADTANQIRRYDEELVERVRERPLVAVAVALAAGYFVGRLFSRFG